MDVFGWLQPAQGQFGQFRRYWLQLNLVFFFDISNGMKPGFVPVKMPGTGSNFSSHLI